jgi:membrane fusion protein (multidrug efflux system)
MPTYQRFFLPSPQLALAVMVSLAVVGCSKGNTDQGAATTAAAPKAKEVGVVTLKPERLAFTTELAGRTAAPVVAQIRPQVGGIVQQRLFTEGSLVKAGQVLYQLDPATLEAVRASAAANVRKADTTLATARSVAARNAELVKIDAISQQLNEQTQAAALQAEAELAVARASEQTARINLARTRITSPINGWVEMSTVTAGALVTADQATPLTTVQQLDPVYVHVTQSSAELLRLKRELASGRLSRGKSDEAPIKLLLEDGSTYPHAGKLTFSGVTVDPGTGSVTLRAVVPNPDRLLMPGMYVRAVLQEGVAEEALLVPQQGVTRAPDGSASAVVVGPGDKLVKRDIVVGRAVGSRWQVLSGLAAGDRVLVEGSQRARVGDVVHASEVMPKVDGAAPPNGVNGVNGAGPGPVASAGQVTPKLR